MQKKCRAGWHGFFSGKGNIKAMKSRLLILLCLSLLFSYCSEKEPEEKKTEPFEELPPNILESKPCTTLYQGIMEMYPEHERNNEVYANLFSASAQKQIVLTKNSEVFITFISEGAGWSNTLGYYTYNVADPPKSPSDFEKKVLFPNVSNEILKQGDMLRVGDGEWPAGTVIGFFLIPRGYQDGLVYYTRTTLYTDLNLNRNAYQQHVLFKEGECGDIVLGFEDRLQDLTDCDFDYNDIIMTVADNTQQLETTSFKMDNLVVLSK